MIGILKFVGGVVLFLALMAVVTFTKGGQPLDIIASVLR